MRLGSTNRIVDESDYKAVDFDRLITSIQISTIKIKLTIANLIQKRSIFDINQFKSIISDILSIKRSIKIDLMSII